MSLCVRITMKLFSLYLFFVMIPLTELAGFGRLTMWIGPMCAGKSDALIDYARECERHGINVFAVKPSAASRDGNKIVARSEKIYRIDDFITTQEDLLSSISALFLQKMRERRIGAVIFDEFQFFSPGIIHIVMDLLGMNINVGVAALDFDFRRQPFPVVALLMQEAYFHIPGMSNFKLIRLSAICEECRRRGHGRFEARYSQRLVSGVPTTTGDIVGIMDTYEPRCEDCFKFSS